MKSKIAVVSLAVSLCLLGGISGSQQAFAKEIGKAEVPSQAAKDIQEATRPGAGKAAKHQPTKNDIEHAKNQQKKADKAMIEAVNQIDGVKVKADAFEDEDAKDKGFQLHDLNPVKYIFKPVTDMQKRVIHLEKQMMRLEGPIAGLQKPMLGLRTDMVDMSGEVKDMRQQLNGVSGNMSSVDQRLGHVEQQLNQIYKPITELKQPVVDLAQPLGGVGTQLSTLKKDLKELKDVVSLTTTLILVAIVGVGLLICVGTPVAALFAYRHRFAIMEKLGNRKDVQVMKEETGKGKSQEPTRSAA
ncbi:MAG: hypothetical protein SFY67_06125 [Candidatus Melainabacteria bacterium]|nr:hypothetical protein [Candidatus Melainabacteria bacterium]